MALVVENGTGLVNAQAYIDIAYADIYASQRNKTDWANGNFEKKEGAIIAATQYLDVTFKFKGQLTSITQALSFPRDGLTDRDGRQIIGVPERVKQACAELAIIAISQSLIVSPETAAVKSVRNKVGELETQTEYAIASGSTSDASPAPLVDRLLSDFIDTGSTSSIGGGFAKFVQG